MLAGTLGGRILVVFGYPYACDTDTRRAAMTAFDLAALARQRADEMDAGKRRFPASIPVCNSLTGSTREGNNSVQFA